MRWKLTCTLVTGLLVAPAIGLGAECLEWTADVQRRLEAFVQESQGLTRAVSVVANSLDSNCYRRVAFASAGDAQPFRKVYHLSPDQRYLAEGFTDTTIAPERQKALARAQTMRDLTNEARPSLGTGEKIRMVLFSDLECAFCRQGVPTLLDEISTSNLGVTLSYRHFPRERDGWSGAAAQFAACVGREDDTAFWGIVRTLLGTEQESIEALKAKTGRLVEDQLGASSRRSVERCLESREGATLVEQDLRLGLLHEVKGTPTLFVNGFRVEGLANTVQIKSIVNQVRRIGSDGEEQENLDR